MNFVKVTVIDTVLSESGEKKISLGGRSSNHLDQHGYSIEQYEDMGIPIPEDSTHNNFKKIEDGGVVFEDEDLEIIKSVAYFSAKDFKLVVAREDYGSTIYLKDNLTLDVLETPLQVKNKLKNLHNKK